MAQLLKTNQATYLFDPEDEALVLKKRGKFSSVYIAYELPEKTPVILKVLNPSCLNDLEVTSRFHREAVIGNMHPRLQHVKDFYRDENSYILIKEYIKGDTLKFIYQEYDNLPAAFYVKCMIDTLDILSSMHEQKYIHCDIRPDNILVSHLRKRNMPDFMHPQVHVLDPGQSKIEDETFSGRRAPFALVYSPPEQMLNYGAYVNATSDVYSCAITLYQCITGTIPFFNEHPERLMHLQLNTDLQPHPKMPKELFPVLLKASFKSHLSLPPSQMQEEDLISKIREGQGRRYQSAEEFRTELGKVLQKLPQDIRKRSFWNW